MPSKQAPRLVALAAFACSVAAQNVTVPAVMNGVEGGGGTGIPFGSNLACRYQCIYDAQELPWTGPRQLNGISLRADNGTPTTPGAAMPAKGWIDISVLLSTTHANSATASGTFADNYGEDATWTISYGRIQLPAQPLAAAGPRPANIDLMFPTPWFYGLTPARHNQPAPTNLLVEIWIQAQPAGAYRIDNLGGCVAPTTTFGNQGPLCLVPGNAAPTLTTDASMLAGSNFTWTVGNGPANAPFLLAINLTNQGGLFGQAAYPLPYPMFDPTNPALPSPALVSMRWPAPDCWLNIDPVVNLFGVCNSAGVGTILTHLPPGRQFVGTVLFGQGILYSQTANQLQLVTTLGRGSTICGPLGVVRIYSFYNGSGVPVPAPPTGGSVQFGLGMVFEVR